MNSSDISLLSNYSYPDFSSIELTGPTLFRMQAQYSKNHTE